MSLSFFRSFISTTARLPENGCPIRSMSMASRPRRLSRPVRESVRAATASSSEASASLRLMSASSRFLASSSPADAVGAEHDHPEAEQDLDQAVVEGGVVQVLEVGPRRLAQHPAHHERVMPEEQRDPGQRGLGHAQADRCLQGPRVAAWWW